MINTVIITVVAVLLPLLSLWGVMKVMRVKKIRSSTMTVLGIAAVLTSATAWVLAQIFLPLAYAGPFLTMLAASWLMPEFSVRDRFSFAAGFSFIYIAGAVLAVNLLVPIIT